MKRLLLLVWLSLGACDNPSAGVPAGTPTDPVETCARLGQVCRFSGQQLGVCQFLDSPTPEPKFICVSQH